MREDTKNDDLLLSMEASANEASRRHEVGQIADGVDLEQDLVEQLRQQTTKMRVGDATGARLSLWLRV
jgi:hypothetical protein